MFADALIGYGLDGDVREPARGLIEWRTRREAPAVSLDVPSGILGAWVGYNAFG